MDLTERRRQFL